MDQQSLKKPPKDPKDPKEPKGNKTPKAQKETKDSKPKAEDENFDEGSETGSPLLPASSSEGGMKVDLNPPAPMPMIPEPKPIGQELPKPTPHSYEETDSDFKQKYMMPLIVGVIIVLIIAGIFLGLNLFKAHAPSNQIVTNTVYSTTTASTTSTTTIIPNVSYGTAIGDIYCVGGDQLLEGNNIGTDRVFVAPITTSGGVGLWSPTTPYPKGVLSTTCNIYYNNIYCVAGASGFGSSAAQYSNVYYAPIEYNGIGKWTATTSFPNAGGGPGCAMSNGDIYCVESGGDAYYAPVVLSGLGAWKGTNSYPMKTDNIGCTFYNGDLWCAANKNNVYSFYYAGVSSSGIGTWNKAATWPAFMYYLQSDAQSLNGRSACASFENEMYCISNNTRAPITIEDVGPFTGITPYPIPSNEWMSCVTQAQDA